MDPSGILEDDYPVEIHKTNSLCLTSGDIEDLLRKAVNELIEEENEEV